MTLLKTIFRMKIKSSFLMMTIVHFAYLTGEHMKYIVVYINPIDYITLFKFNTSV